MLVGLICLLMITCGPATAKTWHVEKDGSGDYTIIQEAVDAAASGDTIRIGPGRFNDRRFYTYPGWSDSVIVTVFQYELTLIGSGPETILGQNFPWTEEQGGPKGISTGDLIGNSVIRIHDLRIENMRDGIYTSYESSGADTVIVSGCTFYQNDSSVSLIGDGGIADIEDCSFFYTPAQGLHIAASNQRTLTVTNCDFTLLQFTPITQVSISLMAVVSSLFDNCNFHFGAGGLNASLGGTVSIQNCLFSEQSNAAISSGFLSDIVVDKCTFTNPKSALVSVTGDNQIIITNSIITGVTDCSILLNDVGTLTVNNCNLAKGERGVVYVQDIPNCNIPTHLDFTNNYWGTDNPDSIQAWIRDHNDSNQACSIVDYEPFRGISTPVQEKSIGSIKAMFR